MKKITQVRSPFSIIAPLEWLGCSRIFLIFFKIPPTTPKAEERDRVGKAGTIALPRADFIKKKTREPHAPQNGRTARGRRGLRGVCQPW
jgi:hypothetical protein